MREIKFRGRCTVDGFKNKWIYGYGVFIDDAEDTVCELYTTEGIFEVEPDSVGQYTGLKDKNGKEIYEGDIIKSIRGYKATVEWTDDGRFLGRTVDRSIVYVGQEPAVEVIGNIYDNPELLTA